MCCVKEETVDEVYVCEWSSAGCCYYLGMRGSATAAFIARLINSKNIKSDNKYIFILNDIEDAGYFYHDLIQIAGNENILFFPSSYKRAIKYGQIDSASEILRTEALNRLKQPKPIMLVTYPEAIAEKVVSKELLTERTLQIRKGENYDLSFIGDMLFEFGFERVDYVYEPGQYAQRGSIIDVYSFSNDLPFRLDFFGNEIDSIRTFEIDTQLSKEKLDEIFIIPNLQNNEGSGISILDFIDQETWLGFKDLAWVNERISAIVKE